LGVPDGNGAPDAGWLSGERHRSNPKAARTMFLSVAPELIFELISPSTPRRP